MPGYFYIKSNVIADQLTKQGICNYLYGSEYTLAVSKAQIKKRTPNNESTEVNSKLL